MLSKSASFFTAFSLCFSSCHFSNLKISCPLYSTQPFCSSSPKFISAFYRGYPQGFLSTVNHLMTSHLVTENVYHTFHHILSCIMLSFDKYVFYSLKNSLYRKGPEKENKIKNTAVLYLPCSSRLASTH